MNYKFAKKALIVIFLLLMVVGCGRGENVEVPAVAGEGAEAPAAAEEGAEAPAAEEGAEAPAAEEGAEAPAAEEGAEQPAAEEGAAEQPAVEEGAEQPAAEEGAAEQPAAEEGAAEQPAVEEGVAEQPAAEEGAAEQPAAEQPATGQPANLTGDWDLNLSVNQWLYSDGRTEDVNVTARILASLTQNGSQLSGNFLEVSIDGFDDACTQASITGTIIDDSQVKWTMNYSGDCCPGQQISFLGTYDPQLNALTGSFSPLGTPPDSCRPWFADVTGSQR